MTSSICHFATLCSIALLAMFHFRAVLSGSSDDLEFPQRPVKVVVPFKAGGGTDLFARLIQRAVADEDLLGQPLVIVNQGGGSGTIGSRSVKQAKPDGYKILCLHDGIMTSKLAGMVNYGPEAFEPIAQTGDMVLMVVARHDASFQNLAELMHKVKASPNEITFGANMGAPAHFAGRLLEDAWPGAKFNYVQSGGGANRYALLIGNHIDVGVFSLSEFISFRQDDKIRALGVLSPQRHALLSGVATAKEQGVDVASGNALYWWAPKGTPGDRVRLIAHALSKAMDSQHVRSHAIDPIFRSGPDLQVYLAERFGELTKVSMPQVTELPHFPAWIMTATGILLVLTLWTKSRSGREQVSKRAPDARPIWKLLLSMLVLCLYVLALQFSALGYVMLTALMVFVVGGIICEWHRSRLATLLEMALLTGLGTHVIFSQFLSVGLP